MTHRVENRRPGANAFTLVEGLIALALAGLVVVGLFTYFGFTLQSFSQEESTITSAQTAQTLLAYLRNDITAADGMDTSVTVSTGTTFPKSSMHFVQTFGSPMLQPHIHVRTLEPQLRPGTDPLRDPMPPTVRTGVWIKQLELQPDHPIAGFLPPGNRSNDLLRAMNYAKNAATWVVPREGTRFFNVNVRDGALTNTVTYAYFPDKRVVRRTSPSGETWIGYRDVASFYVSPVFEFLVGPPPGSTAQLLRVFYEVAFTVAAEQGGAKITKRALDFRTHIAPRHLNVVLKSRWGI